MDTTTTITIHRSKEYLTTRATATGESQPEAITVSVAPAQLSERARAVLLAISREPGVYPDQVPGIPYSGRYVISPRGSYGRETFSRDAEADAITPEILSDLIESAAAAIEAGRVKDEQRQHDVAEREAREREERAAARAAREARETAEREAARAAEERRTAQLAEWVATHGTPNQQARHAAGLLPESEVVDAIRGEVFAPLADEPRYEKITASEVRATCDDYSDDYPGDTVTFCVDPATDATAQEWDAMARVRDLTAVIGGSVTVRLDEHLGQWDCGDDSHPLHEITRRSLLVTVIVGELTLTRRYAAS